MGHFKPDFYPTPVRLEKLVELEEALKKLPYNQLKGLKNSKDFKFEFEVKRSWVLSHVDDSSVPVFLRRV